MLYLLTLSAHAREGYSSHFVCLSVFFFIVGKVPFSGLNLHQYILGDNLSVLNVALFENRSYFGEKASGTSAVTAVSYSGNAQSLNGFARDLLARRTLYQSCHFLVPALVSSIRVVISMVAGLLTAFLSSK